ncbi:4'-phosphopantetheinyl transferase superfamily protein [Stenotrophomonas sp. MMGLT7]|uniref:4'-phosphopantetheinyl transferase family protein n=1 Tax=Stenotrophomonas sp. MMGLT7 TaxID=2901227 RepID=UPI001E3E013D|nr:4'-phosphopantetheinyl transferase superfamily protein [Stenotrophomonas sp. MMGLT7]MCD7099547.1 4'-phosphopantetheinyl transferase superfamily protein [Stenotrophomonas sp. MMGLT7]
MQPACETCPGDDWRFGPVRVWRRSHRPGDRGEPQARQLLSAALQVDAAAVPVRREERGRPWLDQPFARYGTGWSHSGDQLLVALGENVRLGVDLERIRARPRMLEIARRYFHADEVAALDDAPSGQARELLFFRLWCAKEALLKAHGHGISFGLHRLAFADGPQGLRLRWCDPALGRAGQWHLHEWLAAPGYRAALAWYSI